ncbi:spore germination protein [Cohnella endophytica]|uniref:Spore germination protein n=2 Tax=Cohnella endophytica TaxID=2419778 RepID=A0A494Y5N9_9BACL|nr:spore germination protein [Cohnella endophytica]
MDLGQEENPGVPPAPDENGESERLTEERHIRETKKAEEIPAFKYEPKRSSKRRKGRRSGNEHETEKEDEGAEAADEHNSEEGGEATGEIRSRDDQGTKDDQSANNEQPGFKPSDSEQTRKRQKRIPDDIESWKELLVETIGLDKSFEVQVRDMIFGGKRVALLFLSVFAKDTSLMEIIKRLTYLEPDSTMDHDAMRIFLENYVPAIQIKKSTSFPQMIDEVLMGNTAFYVDGEPAVLLIDAKSYPARNPEQPSLEKVVRGSQDGFTETLIVNVALIRRRLRDPNLRFEILKVGRRTQTDVCIGYIDDIANTNLVESIRDKIKAIDVDGLPLADKQLEEMTVSSSWSPFPLVRYTERPDVVAAQLLDGSVTVIVDTSPSAILLPTTYFDLVQHAEENRQNPFMGTYMRWVRFLGMFASLFLMPLWFLFNDRHMIRPQWLWFVGAEKVGQIPLIFQFLIAEVGVDLLRLAAVHTPAPLVTAMTLLSAILIGDIAVKTGLFINEVILYMAVSAIGMFATPSYELGLANRIIRLGLLLAVFFFHEIGFVVGTTFVFLFLAFERSFNAPYLWPFLPFNAKAFSGILFRKPLSSNKKRLSIYRTKKQRKQPQ